MSSAGAASALTTGAGAGAGAAATGGATRGRRRRGQASARGDGRGGLRCRGLAPGAAGDRHLRLHGLLHRGGLAADAGDELVERRGHRLVGGGLLAADLGAESLKRGRAIAARLVEPAAQRFGIRLDGGALGGHVLAGGGEAGLHGGAERGVGVAEALAQGGGAGGDVRRDFHAMGGVGRQGLAGRQIQGGESGAAGFGRGLPRAVAGSDIARQLNEGFTEMHMVLQPLCRKRVGMASHPDPKS